MTDQQLLNQWLEDTKENPPDFSIFSSKGKIDSTTLRNITASRYLDASKKYEEPQKSALILADDAGYLVANILRLIRAQTVFIPLDPHLPLQRLASMVGALPKVPLLYQEDYEELAFALSPHAVPACNPYRVSPSPTPFPSPALVDAPCYRYFTSGSSGQPKPIEGRLSSLLQYQHILHTSLELIEPKRVASLAAPSFDAFLREMLLAQACGGSLHQPESRALLSDGNRLLDWLNASRIQLISCVPSVFRTLLSAAGSSRLPHLEKVLLAGEPLYPEDVARWNQRFGGDTRLYNLYGPTETTLTRFFYAIRPEDATALYLPIGRPMAGTQAWIAGADGLPLAAGQWGQIMIQTAYRSLGYAGRPALTAASFLPSPIQTSGGESVYATGDRGLCEENGQFRIAGRIDRQLKLNGVRVQPEEVEHHLRGWKGVENAAVCARTRDGQTRLHGFLCGDPNQAAGLRAHLVEHLLPAMLPSSLTWLPALPFLPNGKVDRSALLEKQEDTGAYVAPVDQREEVICRCFASVLSLEKVGRFHDFFQLGGHSMLALKLLDRIGKSLDVWLPFHELFRNPTPAMLAKIADQYRRPPRQTAHNSLRRGPLTPGQQRLWMAHQLQDDAYNLTKSWLVADPLDALRLQGAWQAMTQQHHALHTRFVRQGDEIIQEVVAYVPAEMVLIDLRGPVSWEDSVNNLIEATVAGAFNLEESPLAKLYLILLDHRQSLIHLVIHHIIADAWSLRLMEEELFARYAGQPISPKPQFLDLINSPTPDEALLKRRLAALSGVSLAPPLPYHQTSFGRPRSHADQVRMRVPQSVHQACLDLARSLGLTPFSIYLSAFAVALYRHGGASDFLLAVPWFNRERAEQQQAVGMFIETLIVRLDLRGAPDFRTLLNRHRRAWLEAVSAVFVPPERITRALNAPRRDWGNPLTTVSFNYLDLPMPSSLGRLTVSPYTKARTSRARFDFSLLMRGTQVEARYNTALYQRDRITCFLQDFFKELATLVAEPGAPLGQAQACPSPALIHSQVQRGHTPPSTPEERTLAECWSELLDVSRIYREDDFFALGGHSMEALRLIGMLEQRHGVRLTLKDLFVSPTLKEQAHFLGRDKIQSHDPGEMPTEQLSFGQLRLWSIARLQGHNESYNVPAACRIHRPLLPAILHKTTLFLFERQRELCARFPAPDGEPVRRFLDPGRIPVNILDFYPVPQNIVNEVLGPGLRRLLATPFNLNTGPLTKIYIVRDDARSFRLFALFHHAVIDAASKRVFLREFVHIYTRLLVGDKPELPPIAPYTQFAALQHTRDHDVSFWRRYLAEAPAQISLPYLHSRPKHPGFRGGRIRFKLNRATGIALDELAVTLGCTPFQLCMGLFGLLLYRYSGQRDFTVGTPFSERTRESWRNVIGFFANTLVLRFKPSPQTSVRRWLSHVKAQMLETFPFAQVPFERLVRELGADRSTGNPFFQVMCTYRDSRRLFDGSARYIGTRRDTAKFDLLLNMTRSPGRYRGVLAYNSDRFDPATIAQMATHFKRLCARVPMDLDKRLDRISLLNETEKTAFLQMGTHWDENPLRGGLHEPFQAWVRRNGRAGALVDATETLSYADLNSRAGQYAAGLRSKGILPGQHVVLALPRTADLIAAMLGILQVGAVWVPIDSGLPNSRIQQMIATSRARAVITSEVYAHLFQSYDLPLITPNTTPTKPRTVSCATETAYVLFTSGSTGEPKGVAVSHRAALSTVRWAQTHFSEVELAGVVAATPLGFDVAVFEIFACLSSGGQLFLAQDLANPPANEGISMVCLTPSAIPLLSPWPIGAPGSLTINLAGESPNHTQIAGLLQRADLRRLNNIYGPTEAAIYATCQEIDSPEQDPTKIGRPILGRQALVLDHQLSPCPNGLMGGLFLAGKGLASGYLGQAGETAQRFIPHPYGRSAGSRLYQTGDLVVRDSRGDLRFLGRGDRQVKLRGIRIEPGDIESALLLAPNVREAAVAVSRTPQRLIAYVVLGALQSSQVEQRLCEFLGKRLPAAMIPQVWVFLEELPRLPSGKIARTRLPEPMSAESPREPAKSETERTLVGLWKSLLHLDEVGVNESFFALGGDSITAILLAAAARKVGLLLQPRHILASPTIGGQAKLAVQTRARLPENRTVSGSIPPTPIQHWFFGLANDGFFTQYRALELETPLDPPTLKTALSKLSEHHPMLRARYHRANGQWRQSIQAPPSPIPLYTMERTQEHMRREVLRHQRRLTNGDQPPMTALLFRGEAGDRLILIANHLVVDGFSWQILLEDLFVLYEQIWWDEPIQLPPQTASYQAWSYALKELARQGLDPAERTYWQNLLTQNPPFPPHDTEVPATPGTRADEAVQRLTLSTGTTRRLRLAKQAVRGHEQEIILAALMGAFARTAGVSRLAVALENHGRDNALGLDFSRTVGWFTNIYPVLLVAEQDPIAHIKAVKEVCRSVPNHGLGYAVSRYLRKEDLPIKASLLFNFLGTLGRNQTNGFWRRAEIRFPSRADSVARSHLFEINAFLEADQLHMRLSYNRRMYHAETIEALVEAFQSELDGLLDAVEKSPFVGFTPSDFPRAGLDQAALDRLTNALGPAQANQVEEILPMSPLQIGMLYHGLVTPANYHLQRGFRLEKGLDTAAWMMAWETVIARHAALRTRFNWDMLDTPHGWVSTHYKPKWTCLDWSALDEAALEQQWRTHLQEARKQPFALDREPPYRLTLMRLSGDRYYHLFSIHHMLVDGWSLAVIFREVTTLYQGERKGEKVQLESPPQTWDLHDQKSEDLDAAKRFWRTELGGLRFLNSLPRKKEVRQHNTSTLSLAPTTSKELAQLAAERGVSMFNLLQTAWALLLSRYSQNKDLLFGTTVSGRTRPLAGIENLVGLCINTIPVRVRLDQDEALCTLIDDMAMSSRDRENYGLFGLSELQSLAGLPPGRQLFDCLLVYENFPRHKTSGGTNQVKLVHSHDQASYPLVLLAHGTQPLKFRLVYQDHLLDGDSAWILLEHLALILGDMPDHPFFPISELPAMNLPTQIQLFDTPLDLQADPPPPPTQTIEVDHTPTWTTIAAVWTDLLELESVDGGLTFFELGGDSLKLVSVYGRLRRHFGETLDFAHLFAHPTVDGLAHFLDQRATPRVDHGRNRAEKRRMRGKKMRRGKTQKEAAIDQDA